MSKLYFTDRYIPNEGPLDAPIWFIGEAPGEDEYDQGRPFVGRAGDKLMNCLERNGISRDSVRLCNLFHYRPYHNKFEQLLQYQELYVQIDELLQEIATYKPVVVAALGAYPLKFITGKEGINKWRGSILSFIKDHEIKVIPTFHPAFIAREATAYPIFDQDIKRIAHDSTFREKRFPERTLIPNPQGLDLVRFTEEMCDSETISVDIESIKDTTTILCCGFANSSNNGVSISTESIEGQRAVSQILSVPNKKIYHYGTFDTTMLTLNNYELTRDTLHPRQPYYWDTFLGQHILQPELPRSLEYLTSIYTREPYYKTEGRANIPGDTKAWGAKQAKEGLYIYNCKDVCVTFEIYEQQQRELGKAGISFLEYEMRQLAVAHHIGFAGMLQDNERKKIMTEGLLKKWAVKQFVLERLIGAPVNVRSPKLKDILYDKGKLGLPVRRNRDSGITTDEDAIVSLISHCKDHIGSLKTQTAIDSWNNKLQVLKLVLEIRGIRQLLSNYLLAKSSSDNRIRSIYKVGGTETGRWSASSFVDGTGYNAQTNPRDPFQLIDMAIITGLGLSFDDKLFDKMIQELYQEREYDQQELESLVA